MRRSSLPLTLLALGLLSAIAAADIAGEPRPASSGGPGPASDDAAGARAAGPNADTGADALYDRFCLACHGALGDGGGPAAPWLWPRPRDFTRGEYKWRTTPTGAAPTRADLAAAIRHGAPGTSMHGFGAALSDAQIDALVDHVIARAPDEFPATPEDAEPPVAVTPPADRAGLVDRGRQVWAALGCPSCHGDGGAGDGEAAATLRDARGLPAPPYDLSREPLRRPRAPGADPVVAIYTSVVTGLTGTPMPSYAGAAPDRDLWAVAAYVDALRRPDAPPRDPTAVHPLALAIDREQRLTEAGYWPGHGTDDEARIFGRTIELQDVAAARAPGRDRAPRGAAAPQAARGPATGGRADDTGVDTDSRRSGPGLDPGQDLGLPPAVASLSALQCARCHNAQYRQWRDSYHAAAASPGLLAQIARISRRERAVESCQRCHAPLAEQLPVLRPGHVGGDDDARRYRANPRFDPELRREGITCAACHVRGHRRHGPPRPPNAGSPRLALPGYPRAELAIYERSDLCLGCHQLPARLAVDGRPLLNTYREWLEGPYMRRGVQCQHCHMPDREHQWKGVHDPDTFRQGIAVEAIAGRSAATGAVSVRARVTNRGAGHYLPTTPTPAAWLSVELVTRSGQRVRGAYSEKRIGRHIAFERGRFRDVEDTRIPPGDSLELAAAWKDGDVPRAAFAVVKVRVAPDDYYEGLYRKRLALDLPPDVRAQFEEALRRAERARYVAYERKIPIAGATGGKR